MERAEQAKEMWRKAFKDLVDDMKGLTREQLASGFFELGWRAADENPPKGASLIKWQTGKPKECGHYLITSKWGCVDVIFLPEEEEIRERYLNEIVVWCKLDDIAPYKE